MVLASSVSGLFKWRQFEPEVILLAVGWYLRFSLSSHGPVPQFFESSVLAPHQLVVIETDLAQIVFHSHFGLHRLVQ
jgi:hypothetical protein